MGLENDDDGDSQRIQSAGETQDAHTQEQQGKKSGVLWLITTLAASGTGFGLGLLCAAIAVLNHVLGENIQGDLELENCRSWAQVIYCYSAATFLAAVALLLMLSYLRRTGRASRLVSSILAVFISFAVSGSFLPSLFAFCHVLYAESQKPPEKGGSGIQ